jgi:tetratricopeptide (TPR) repeat protein
MKYPAFLAKLVFLLITLVYLQTNVSAKDEWLEVRSKNFTLIGNAQENEIKAVALKLEQFREALRQVLDRYNFNSPVPTTVVVFKTAADYKPYKPVKSNGEADDFVVGYFQAGEDVNYITLSVEGTTGRLYNIIFHEYTHFLVSNNLGESKIPPWYNEGMAGYYETFRIEGDQRVVLGTPEKSFRRLLSQNNLIPFDVFFNTDNYTLHQQGKDGVGLFYAQAWALMHYLKHGKSGARSHQLDKFLSLVMADKTPKAAFFESFGVDYATMEIEVKEYIKQENFPVTEVSFKDKLNFDLEMKTTRITEAQAQTYLGDLLFHTGRFPEAEAHFQKALQLEPSSGMAQALIGLVKLQQEDFEGAEKYLEKAVESDSGNYRVYYNYAFVLSRYGMSDFGFVSEYNAALAEKMRKSLKRAMELNPEFAESYNLYAFISIVRNEEVDEAIGYLNKALKIAPGNQWYLIHLSELLLRKNEFSGARNIAAKVLQTAGDKELKVYAQNTLGRINSTAAAYEEIKNHKKRTPENPLDIVLTDEELAQLRARQMLESLNDALYKPKKNEKRVLGYLTKIECEPSEMIYSVKVEDKILKLRSATFDSVRLMAYSPVMTDGQISCGEMKREALAVISYRPAVNANTKISGEMISIEFVPANFKFLDY